MRARARWVSVAAAASLAPTVCAGPALAGEGGRAGDAHRHPRPVNGFSSAGPWNTPLPASVPLAPNSAAIVANILIASQGTDESTTIYQPSTDTYCDPCRAQKDASGRWSACWGGKIKHYSKNPGIFKSPLGAAASGLPLGAFTIRISERRRGYIDHAINGLIITDHGGAVVTYAEDPRAYEATHGGVNPYPALMDPEHLFPDGDWAYVLTQIPIDQLQALPFNYGEPTR